MSAVESPSSSVRGRRLRARAFAAVACLALAAGLGAAAGGAKASEGPFEPEIVEGDILVAPARFRAIGAVARGRRWSNGEVPYLIAPELEERVVDAIETAIRRWNEVAGVTLAAVPAGVDAPVDHLYFQSGPGCASWVGRQGGRQPVWVGRSCTSGSVMHEIGHALGLEHEHTRPDRDQHVRVLWDNIVPEKRHNFALAPVGAQALGDYDVGSIMHYGPANFSIDGQATLEALDPVAGRRMGQRDAPSTGDIAAVARLYESDLALVLDVDDERAVGEVTAFVTNHHAQGAHAVRIVMGSTTGPLELRGIGGDEGWDCTEMDGGIECRTARLVGHASARVVLELGGGAAAATLRAVVESKTPDVDPFNNRNRVSDERIPSLAAAIFSDPASDGASAPDDAIGNGEGTSQGGGAGPAALLSLALLALRRRRYRTAGSSLSGPSPSSGSEPSPASS